MIYKQIPDYSVFGRKAVLRLNPNKIPDLQWQLASKYHTTNIGQQESQTSNISTSVVDVDTISHAGGNIYESLCETTLNTDTITIQSNNSPIAYFDLPNSNKI